MANDFLILNTDILEPEWYKKFFLESKLKVNLPKGNFKLFGRINFGVIYIVT